MIPAATTQSSHRIKPIVCFAWCTGRPGPPPPRVREQRQPRRDAAAARPGDDRGRQRLAVEAELLRLGERDDDVRYACEVGDALGHPDDAEARRRSGRGDRRGSSPRLASTTALPRPVEPLSPALPTPPGATPITFTLRRSALSWSARMIATGSARTTPVEPPDVAATRASANGRRAGEGPKPLRATSQASASNGVDGAADLVVEAGAHAREQQRQREHERGRHHGDGEAPAPPLEVTEADQPHRSSTSSGSSDASARPSRIQCAARPVSPSSWPPAGSQPGFLHGARSRCDHVRVGAVPARPWRPAGRVAIEVLPEPGGPPIQSTCL